MCSHSGLVSLVVMCVYFFSVARSSTPAKKGGKPLIPRFSTENQNFVSKWQLKGDLYISYDNLLHLNRQCMTFEDKKSNDELRKLLDEVMMTPGQLVECGVNNLRVLKTVLETQKLPYDFTFCSVTHRR